MRNLIPMGFVRCVIALVAVFAWHIAGAVTAGHVDDFEDNTTQGWGEGVNSTNPPANIANGGPAGIGDNFLENLSTGGAGAGSRQIIFNTSAAWTGDFASAGVNIVRLDVKVDAGSEGPVQLRLAFEGGNGARWASAAAVEVPADDTWHSISLPVMESTMTNVSGGGTFTAAAPMSSKSDSCMLLERAGRHRLSSVLWATTIYRHFQCRYSAAGSGKAASTTRPQFRRWAKSSASGF